MARLPLIPAQAGIQDRQGSEPASWAPASAGVSGRHHAAES